MTWRIKRREFPWWIGRGSNHTSEPYTLTYLEADAAEFPTRSAAFAVLASLTSFQSAYGLVEGTDDGDGSDATGSP